MGEEGLIRVARGKVGGEGKEEMGGARAGGSGGKEARQMGDPIARVGMV
jgi:hypothetical protein